MSNLIEQLIARNLHGIFLDIILLLNGEDIKNLKLCCSKFNAYINEFFWKSRKCQMAIGQKIEENWINGSYKSRIIVKDYPNWPECQTIFKSYLVLLNFDGELELFDMISAKIICRTYYVRLHKGCKVLVSMNDTVIMVTEFNTVAIFDFKLNKKKVVNLPFHTMQEYIVTMEKQLYTFSYKSGREDILPQVAIFTLDHKNLNLELMKSLEFSKQKLSPMPFISQNRILIENYRNYHLYEIGTDNELNLLKTWKRKLSNRERVLAFNWPLAVFYSRREVTKLHLWKLNGEEVQTLASIELEDGIWCNDASIRVDNDLIKLASSGNYTTVYSMSQSSNCDPKMIFNEKSGMNEMRQLCRYYQNARTFVHLNKNQVITTTFREKGTIPRGGFSHFQAFYNINNYWK